MIGSFLLIAGLVSFFVSLNKSKHRQFYSDTFWLIPLGIYVWGDGLVLGPFWFLAGFISIFFLDLTQSAILLLLFITIRSFFEIIYWLGHQVGDKTYQAPLFRQVNWLDAGQGAILYQLLHTSVIIFSLLGLFVVIKTWW